MTTAHTARSFSRLSVPSGLWTLDARKGPVRWCDNAETGRHNREERPVLMRASPEARKTAA